MGFRVSSCGVGLVADAGSYMVWRVFALQVFVLEWASGVGRLWVLLLLEGWCNILGIQGLPIIWGLAWVSCGFLGKLLVDGSYMGWRGLTL